MVPYDQIEDSERFWLMISDNSIFSKTSRAAEQFLNLTNLLDDLHIPWTPQEQFGESIAIPISVIWFEPEAYEDVIKPHIYDYYDISVIVKDTWKVIMHCEDLNKFDPDYILKNGVWWNNVRVYENLWSLDQYLSPKSEAVFEELFYLYHCGVFEELQRDYGIKRERFQEKMGTFRKYLEDYMSQHANALRGKYVKILY